MVFFYLVDFIIILMIVLLSLSYLRQRQLEIEIKKFSEGMNPGKEQVIKEEDLQLLPAVVQKWLRSTGVVGKERITRVRIKQKGKLRTSPEADWKPFTAEQYVNYLKPAFLWQAKIKMAPFLFTYGLDKYLDGQGKMRIRFSVLFKIVNATGSEINQGSLLRYLAEIMWQPGAAISEYIEWEEIDERSARAVMSYRGVSAGGIFTFDQEGRATGFTASRYREQDGKYSLDEWQVQVSHYQEFENISIPAQGQISWMLPEGEFQWMQLEITQLSLS